MGYYYGVGLVCSLLCAYMALFSTARYKQLYWIFVLPVLLMWPLFAVGAALYWFGKRRP